MTLLSIVQDAMTLCGLDSPTSVYSSTDATSRQFMAFAQVEGDELSRFHDWRALKVLGTFTGDGSSTVFDLPTDFDRFLPGYAMWLENSPALPLEGPVTDEKMLAFKVAEYNPIRSIWRFFGDQIEFFPALSSSAVVQTEYRSSYWIIDTTLTTRRARWAADTDLAVIPDRLIVLGIVWRWKKAKGFDYSEDFTSYQIERTRATMSDGGKAVIRMSENFGPITYRRAVSDARVIV
jgi:hypothetical protein